jgi:hypothetical protein
MKAWVETRRRVQTTERFGNVKDRMVLMIFVIFIATGVFGQEKYETWRREPPRNKSMEQELDKAALDAQKAQAASDYLATFNIYYPHNQKDYSALDGNAVVYVTILSKIRAWFPIQRISVISEGVTTVLTPIYSVLTNQTESQSLPVKMFGQYRADVLCLFPVSLRLKPGVLVADLSGTSGRLKLTTFSATPPAFIAQIMTETTPGKGPSEQVLARLIQEEMPGLLDITKTRNNPGSKEELDEITVRGKKLFQYDLAAWQASDDLKEIKPDWSKVSGYVAKEDYGYWTVYFGRLNENKDKYLVVYEVSQIGRSLKFKANELSTPREEGGFLLAGKRAIETAKMDVGYRVRTYNISVFPAPSGCMYVYFLVAQKDSKSYPLGGDVRYLISPDGTKILEKRIMHLAVSEYQVSDSEKVQNSFHSAVMDDIPEDSDVFHVLMRRPASDELVLTPNYVYKIKSDGSIQYLMKAEY